MESEKNVSAVILAAGNSDRMKFPKPFLKWDQKITFIEKLMMTYEGFKCKQIIVVLNPEGYKQFCELFPNKDTMGIITAVLNDHPEYERFYSIQKGISVIKNDDFCFIQNVDNPLTDRLVLEKIYKSIDTNDCFVPTYDGKGGHPILINKKIIEKVNVTPHKNTKFNEFLKQFKRKNVIFNRNSILYNINTIEEYHKLFDNNLPEIK